MAFDCFLKIDGVPGESTDAKHADWIELESYAHGLSQPSSGAQSSGGARSGERTTHDDFTVVKPLDKASPKLALFCCRGDHIPKIVMELCRATGDKQLYMKYTMYDTIVSFVRPGGSAASADPLPMEEAGFNYGKIEWEYTETDHKTGGAGGTILANWSLVDNTGG